ncbi:MAG TPA: 30S ribosomal protein S20 [Planctomycetes bacterium]|nr:30S ribosomal protein S20 [Planctomycetota bacterium]
MPHLRSSKKALRQARRRAEANKAQKSNMRTLVKKAIAAAGSGQEAAGKAYRAACSALDRAAKKNVIHKNAADRKKARLAKALNKALASAQPPPAS